MTEPQDKNIFYAHIFLQKATFELLFAARFDDAKTDNVGHERALKLQKHIDNYTPCNKNDSQLNEY